MQRSFNSNLQADDVGVVLLNLFKYDLPSVFPIESPWRTVSIELPRAVFVAQNVVAHYHELHCKPHYWLHGSLLNITKTDSS